MNPLVDSTGWQHAPRRSGSESTRRGASFRDPNADMNPEAFFGAGAGGGRGGGAQAAKAASNTPRWDSPCAARSCETASSCARASSPSAWSRASAASSASFLAV